MGGERSERRVQKAARARWRLYAEQLGKGQGRRREVRGRGKGPVVSEHEVAKVSTDEPERGRLSSSHSVPVHTV